MKIYSCIAPGTVQNIVSTAPSVDVLTVMWEPPANVFFTLAGYQVTLETVDTVLYDELVTKTTLQVPNLGKCYSYYVPYTAID